MRTLTTPEDFWQALDHAPLLELRAVIRHLPATISREALIDQVYARIRDLCPQGEVRLLFRCQVALAVLLHKRVSEARKKAFNQRRVR